MSVCNTANGQFSFNSAKSDEYIFTLNTQENIQLYSYASLKHDVLDKTLPIQTSVMKVAKFDPNNLPMFCKMEHKFWSKTKMNIRFRLGSVDYVNKMEGK